MTRPLRTAARKKKAWIDNVCQALAIQYGWSIDTVAGMTLIQIRMYAAGLASDQPEDRGKRRKRTKHKRRKSHQIVRHESEEAAREHMRRLYARN